MKPRYWFSRLIIVIEVLFLIALPGLLDPGTLVFRTLSGPGGFLLLSALIAACLLGMADVLVNDLMPGRFRFERALENRQWGYLAIALLLAMIAFVSAYRSNYFNGVVLACWVNFSLSGAIGFLDMKSRFNGAPAV